MATSTASSWTSRSGAAGPGGARLVSDRSEGYPTRAVMLSILVRKQAQSQNPCNSGHSFHTGGKHAGRCRTKTSYVEPPKSILDFCSLSRAAFAGFPSAPATSMFLGIFSHRAIYSLTDISFDLIGPSAKGFVVKEAMQLKLTPHRNLAYLIPFLSTAFKQLLIFTTPFTRTPFRSPCPTIF